MRARMATLAGLTLLAGCVKEMPVAGGSAFTFELWVPAGLVVAGLVGLAIGALLLKRRRWIAGIVVGLLGLFGLVVFGPGLFQDKVTVTDERFELTVGFWFAPTVHRISLADGAGIEGTAEEKTGRRGRKTTDFKVVFKQTSGPSETVPVGDLMKRGAYNRLLEVAGQKGIPVSGVGPEMDD